MMLSKNLLKNGKLLGFPIIEKFKSIPDTSRDEKIEYDEKLLSNRVYELPELSDYQ